MLFEENRKSKSKANKAFKKFIVFIWSERTKKIIKSMKNERQ